MTVDQQRVIDIVSNDKLGSTILTISDHLDWIETDQHLEILQDKINAYLAFVESGEIYEKFPETRSRPIRIEVVFQHKPNPEGFLFLSKAQSIVESAGFGFHFEPFAATPYEI